MNKNKSSLTYSLTYFIILVLLVSGCATGDVASKHKRKSFATDVDYIKYVDNRLNSLKTFTGSGKLKISNSKKSDSATCAILINRPDSIRLESFSIFGQAVFYFAAEKDVFSIFIPKENKFFFGENTLENIKKVLPLDVSINEFARYVAGDFLKGTDDNVVIKLLEDTQMYKIYYYGAQKKVVWLDPETLTITRCNVLNADDELKAIVAYSDFEEIEGMMFPMKISIKFPEMDAEINLSYDEIKINDSIDESLFTLAAPDNSEVIDLNLIKVRDK